MAYILIGVCACEDRVRGLNGHQSYQPEEEKFILDEEEHKEEVVSSQDGNVVEP